MKPEVRCAIYTRKSTDEGLDQDFNSLDAQRESGEAFVKSQASEGWICLPEKYDDGGFTGGNMDRPALRRLMRDIKAGKIDVVVVYKVDRLSRSLLDFARMIEIFDQQEVAFTSVTQAFSTTTSLGKLTLNILLSFAQFEREIISERTRDKMGAARKRGKYIGGRPVLGYDVEEKKLVPSETEIPQVREIFAMYLEHRSLLPVVRELNRRDWTTKKWTSQKGKEMGGAAFTKNNLHHMLTNVIYIGKVGFQDEVYEGEHQGIVDESVFQEVKELLKNNSRGGPSTRTKSGALLNGLLRCVHCDCNMTHTFTAKQQKRYRYYQCGKATRQGFEVCPSPSIPAQQMEDFVVGQIRGIGQDAGVLDATVLQARELWQERKTSLELERLRLQQELKSYQEQLADLAGQPAGSALEQIRELLPQIEQRIWEADDEIHALQGNPVDESELRNLLVGFDKIWNSVTAKEKHDTLHLLIERVDYNGQSGEIEIHFHPTGLQKLVSHLQEDEECRD